MRRLKRLSLTPKSSASARPATGLAVTSGLEGAGADAGAGDVQGCAHGPGARADIAHDVGANGLESTVTNATCQWACDMSTMFRSLRSTCHQSLAFFHKQLLAMSAALVSNRDDNVVTPKVDRLLIKAGAHYKGVPMADMEVAQKMTYLSNIIQAVSVTDANAASR